MTEFLEPYDPEIGDLFRRVAADNTKKHLDSARAVLDTGDKVTAKIEFDRAIAHGAQIFPPDSKDIIDRHTGVRNKPLWSPTQPEHE